jgi:hypothetical protein
MPNPGLDYATSEDTSSQSVPVKETISVGGTKIPLRAALNGDVIKNLQDEIDKRQGGFLNPVLRGFERAAAFTSRDPGTALAANDASRRAEDESIFGMRNSIATIKAAQQQAAARAAQWNAMNRQGGAGQAAPVGGTGQAQANAGAGAGVSISPQQLAIEEGLETSDEKIAARQKYLEQLNQANARGQAEAAGNKQEEYRDPRTGALIGYFTPNQVKQNPSLISGAVPTGNVAPSQATAFSDPSIHITSAQRSPQQGKELYQTSVDNGTPGIQPNGIPVAKPGTSQHEIMPAGDVYDIDPSKLTTAGRTELAQKGYYQPYGKDSVHWQKIPSAGATSAAVSAAPVNPRLSTIEQHQIDVQKAKDAAESSKAGSTIEEQEAAKLVSSLESKSKDRDQTKIAAQTIIDEAKNNPKAFGYQQQGGILGTAAAAPVVGEGVSNMYAAASGDAKTRARVDAASTLLGVENTKDLFGGIGARIGAQLMGVGTTAKGVGTHLTAEDNLKRARFVQMGVDKADEQAAAWQQFKKSGGNGFQFMQSPENKRIEAKYETMLSNEFPSEYKKAGEEDQYEYRTDPNTGKTQRRKKQ